MVRRLASLALGVVAWPLAAGAQPSETDDRARPPSNASTSVSQASVADTDPPRPHPLFGIATLSGELGGNYAAGAKLGVLATPFSGVSLGGAAFFAPLTRLPSTCVSPCNLDPLLFRGMAELRVGNPYTDYARGLAWFGVSAGIEYLAEPSVEPSPSVALAAGGDLRLSPSLWLEVSLRLTWAQIIGTGSPFAGAYFTFGLEGGLRFDFAH